MNSQKDGIQEKLREQRNQELDKWKILTQEIITIFDAAGKSYTIMDLLKFSCTVLVEAGATLDPRSQYHIKNIVGMLLDGEIALKENLNNGVLSIQDKQKPS